MTANRPMSITGPVRAPVPARGHRLAVKGAPTFSGRLLTGDTYAYTFDQPGAFGFVCIEHPATRGVVVVTSAGS